MSHSVPLRPTRCIHLCPTLSHSVPQGVSTYVPHRPTFVPLLSHSVPLLSHSVPLRPTFVPLRPTRCIHLCSTPSHSVPLRPTLSHSVPQGISTYVPLLSHSVPQCPTFVKLYPTQSSRKVKQTTAKWRSLQRFDGLPANDLKVWTERVHGCSQVLSPSLCKRCGHGND